MSIVLLADTNYYRDSNTLAIDSLGNFYMFGRTFSSAAELNDSFYQNNSQPEKYTPSTGAWTILANPIRKLYQAAWTIDSSDRLIASGAEDLYFGQLGTTSQGGSPPDTFMYDTVADTWHALPNSAYAGTGTPGTTTGTDGANYAAFRYNGQLYVTPGASSAADVFYHYTGGTSGSWVAGSAVAPTASLVQDLTLTNPWFPTPSLPINTSTNVVYFRSTSAGSGMKTYSPVTDTWGSTAHAPFATASLPCAWDGSRFLYFVIRISGIWQLYSYDTVADVWTNTSTFPTAYNGTNVAATNAYGRMIATPAHIYFLGYRDASSVGHGDVLAYNVSGATWTNMAATDSLSSFPTARPIVLKDNVGTGFYLVGAEIILAGQASKQVWYFDPGIAPTVAAVASLLAQIIG